ncbi:OmpW/AlkL family protein [Microbulbifer hainanensis]|uniref:OmpW/AlkL family protein n=1 Tax=Microbulbifer hainanensis TaxID=2735675 RepID=UPI00186776E2|nr:OmpW family outer membrane protein [Microbulbifer hainanensis]
MKMTRILIPAMAPLALAVSGVASAGPSGYVPAPPPPPQQNFMVRIGGSYVTPSSDTVTFADDTFQFFDAFRARLDPDDEWGWFINGEWKPTDHWGFELSYTDAGSFRGGNLNPYVDYINDIYDLNLDRRFRDIGEFDVEVSTASLKYYPLDPSCMFQPYVGGGVSYTDFSGENFRGILRQDLRDLGLRGTYDLGYSWGYTWQIGADFNFGHDSAWLVNVAAIYVRSESDAQFSVFDREPPPVDVEPIFESYSGDYNFNPWLFNIGVGYKFSF